MKKAAQKSAPASPAQLGTKRTCPKCATKFYDFGKTEVNCPKCDTEVDIVAPSPFSKIVAESKRPKSADKVATEALSQPDEVVMEEGDTFESVDDLGDDDDEVVEDIDVDDDADDEN